MNWEKHGGGRKHRPGTISDRKAGIAVNDLLAQHRPLARFAERCRVDDPVAKMIALALNEEGLHLFKRAGQLSTTLIDLGAVFGSGGTVLKKRSPSEVMSAS